MKMEEEEEENCVYGWPGWVSTVVHFHPDVYGLTLVYSMSLRESLRKEKT